MVKGKYTWHMSRMMCDLSHDKLCNLSYRVKANLQLRLLKKKKTNPKKKKACVDTKILQNESQPNTLKRLEGWQSTRLETKETLQNKDTVWCKALMYFEDVLVRYFMTLPPRAWIYKLKLRKLPVSNFFSNGTCFKAIFSFLTFFSNPFILTIPWQWGT